jgi:transcriptional regulator with XRE-family HTH domain
MDAKELAEKVSLRRNELGLSQQALADRAQISRNYVSLIERAEAQNVSTAVLEQLATALQLAVTDLLGNSPRPSNTQFPPSLWEFALQRNLSAEIVERLARLPRRGREPDTPEEWRKLYEAIRQYIDR